MPRGWFAAAGSEEMDIGHLLVPVFRALVCRTCLSGGRCEIGTLPSPLAEEGTKTLALSRAVASAMPARASTPWEAAGRRLAWGRGAR